ncbi:NAD(P)/FAD-dependent oxidoreductase [Saccharomonospora xinjiangensis]|uniref:NAD(P)/FAD-dependent oxidoreductase n=1 Tax=Saccharomonospora xinjiangensis TaxID=75294 RepID=UPI0014305860|nr:NAD(P)/FAD-dependent oxidoreductase [Saccharomonospora xinjiangensis]
MDNHRDVVIIGAGAAGLSAGLVLARAQADVVVVDEGKPRNAPAAHMHGFLSRDGVAPSEFLAKGREELARYGGELIGARVVEATKMDSGFTVVLDTGAIIHARAVLVATGLTDELPEIEGVRERWGSEVHHCPHCHGHEVRGRGLVVIGGEVITGTLHQAALLRRFSNRVTLCPHRTDVSEDDRARLRAFGVRIVDGTVTRLVGDDSGGGRLIGVEFADGSVQECDAVFVAPRPRPNDAVLRTLGCTSDDVTGWVAADATGATSVPGVWAAGNVINPRAQVITAAGQASATAIAITAWLLDGDVTAAAVRADTSGQERR